MQELSTQKWCKAEEQGLRFWIIKKAALGWGLAMFAALVTMLSAHIPDHLLLFMLINTLAGLVVGTLFGVLSWHAMKWQYNRDLHK